MFDVALSKSSMYDALSCVPDAMLEKSFANSALNCMFDGSLRCSSGILLSRFVSHWLSCFQCRLKPTMVLLMGSAPIATFVVRLCSLRCCTVPLIWKFFEKSYSQFSPKSVLRCMP